MVNTGSRIMSSGWLWKFLEYFDLENKESTLFFSNRKKNSNFKTKKYISIEFGHTK